MKPSATQKGRNPGLPKNLDRLRMRIKRSNDNMKGKMAYLGAFLTKEAKNPLPIRLGNASFLPYPGSIKKAPRFPEVVLVNATYRTNQYYMPDVNIIGVSNAGCQQHGRPDWCRSTWYIPPPDIPPILPNDLWHPSSSSPKTEDENIEAVPETDDFGWCQEDGPFIHPKLPSCFGVRSSQ